jgi:hypothetical protein
MPQNYLKIFLAVKFGCGRLVVFFAGGRITQEEQDLDNCPLGGPKGPVAP